MVIEEAAGISKYKERRHETEIRMRHTQENLERLQDLRDEFGKQIGKLQRQARKAEKYTALKAEERAYRLQLLGLRWRKYDRFAEAASGDTGECGQAFRHLVSEDNSLIEVQEEAKARHSDLQRAVNAKQGAFYELGAEISRLEQAIKHAHRTREDLLREVERLGADHVSSLAELEQDREQIDGIREELAALEMQDQEVVNAVKEAENLRRSADEALKHWRDEWDAYRSESGRQRAQVDLQRSRIRQMEDQQRQLETRQERLNFERSDLQDVLMDSELEALQEGLATSEDELGATRARLEALLGIVRQERDSAKSCQAALNENRAELHAISGKISSLELLQQHAMGKDRACLKQWLEQTGLGDARCLAEHLEVSPGWEAAVETVLGIHLEAVCVESAGRYVSRLADSGHLDSLALFDTARAVGEPGAEKLARLQDCVQSSWDLSALMGAVYRASDLREAWHLAESLAPHESVVTPDGARLGPGWLVLRQADDGKAGVLVRERELRELKQSRGELIERIGAFEVRLAAAEEAIRAGEFEREQKQREANRLSSEITQIKSQLSAAMARSEQARKRLQQLEFELEDIEEQLLQNAEGLAEARSLLDRAEIESRTLESREQQLTAHQTQLEETVGRTEIELRVSRDTMHTLKSRIGTLKSTEQLTVKHLERIQAQHQQITARLDDVNQRLSEAGEPMDEEQQTLEELLQRRIALESTLGELRKQSGEAESQMRSIAESRLRAERELDAVKSRLEQTKLDYQAAEVRRQTVQEQLEEIGVDASEVVPGLSEDAEEKAWQQHVNELVEEITRLGPINLTAMAEYEAQSERMKFLDQQHHDLSESQSTLQQAIEKIDRECRARFKETFDRVNAGIQRMFPKLFGGGQAYLELTERDLLESGVSVMARPPGKRNSSIHLLSGGEKALTAVALVFSIFELNPAPFCLLDEVDAPLDDANVGRFSQLVKEMSERVQFLLSPITR